MMTGPRWKQTPASSFSTLADWRAGQRSLYPFPWPEGISPFTNGLWQRQLITHLAFLFTSKFPLFCLFIHCRLVVCIGEFIQIDITDVGYSEQISHKHPLSLPETKKKRLTRFSKLLVVLFLLEHVIVILLVSLFEELPHAAPSAWLQKRVRGLQLTGFPQCFSLLYPA